ncbi:MAG: Uma2 family endonuclease [Phycisphaerae bacterium]|nr:Uma2 family endonuclease [Gemmatimonadaceae bacterium]
MSISGKDWTVEMLDALPDDGRRYEVIDGELLVTPAPANVHKRAIAELYLLLAPYAGAEKSTAQLVWKPVASAAPLVIDLEAYFREVVS